MSTKKGNELIKVVMVSALCLGLFGAAFVGINNITLAATTEGTQPLQLAPAAVNIPVANTAPVVSKEGQKPDMAMDLIIDSSATPSINALSPEAAADIAAQYIWDMFGESIDGKAVHMVYSNHPAATRATWIGNVATTPEAFMLFEREVSREERIQFTRSILFSFSLDAVTGERINISTSSHWVEMAEEVIAALDERFSRSQGEERVTTVATLSGGAPPAQLDEYIEAPAQLDEYIEATRELAQRHFNTTEVVSVELRNINVIAYDLDENGNLYVTNRQLVFEATDSTGRVAEMAIVEATKQLIWLNTGMNDIVPGWNYVGEEPGLG